ncbi:L,D-transpeptidase family protein [Isoptericola sp. S6320L]|uniref:L,D-transpeptidase family protein n=1 Tax=Isoptericola sp. S6320L TaxID=2926411 RepID=UPI001FF3CC71|nr:L,D-transpeptidase family protein [Isoptericola sp. S6320L]MCK0118510.1 L,D-transpeptidase family protein [Isoptericola sp. S6320L]
MTTTTTPRRRRLSAAAIALALLLVPGCAALSDVAGPQPVAAESSTATQDASSSPESPSAGPAPADDAGTGDAPAVEEPPAERPSAAASPSSGTGTDDDAAEAAPDDEGRDDGTGQAAQDDEPSDGGAEEQAGDDEKDKKDKAPKDKAEKKDEKPDWPAYGASGQQVTALQQRLVDLGYFLPEVDGQFGPATQQAVWALQKAAGLGRDGVVGPRTQEALDSGARPSPQSSSGKVVEIDLARQLLMTVEDGRVTRVLNASSGNGETYEAKGRTYTASTPRGSFAVYMERDYLHESTLELGSMYRPKYFHGSFAVHGSGSIPPWPASHGCVRVSNSAMNWLWDTWGMSQGTPVVVY